MKFKRGDAVNVSYFEPGAPSYCHYKGRGEFVRYVKKIESEWDDPMCVVRVPGHGECFFPVADITKA